MKPRHKRLVAIVGGVALIGAAAGLILYAFQSNLVFFFSPTEVAAGKAPRDRAFREGKGVVAEGRVGPDGVFRASQVLAKHDENYMPPEAAHALEQAQKAGKTVIMTK